MHSFARLITRVLLLCLTVLSGADGADLRTGVFHGEPVVFANVDGVAVYQGDMILGRTADIEGAPGTKRRESSTVSSSLRLWTGGVIPYDISSFPSSRRRDVLAAIAHWNSMTPIQLVERTNQTNYVRFVNGTSTIACSSNVGMIGGPQSISLPEGCGVGEAIHEIGHAVGLYHEQARFDRNRYMTVLYENLDKPNAAQFTPSANSRDLGPYDFYSIMHYGPTDFSRDDYSPVMETVPAGIPFGQRNGLSAGDIDAVAKLYGQLPQAIKIATTPPGLKIRVDGALVDDGTTFPWAAGSQHTLEAPFQGDDQTRYLFGSWSDGGEVVHTITVDPNKTLYVANFIRQYKVGVAITPADAGTVTLDPASPDGFYNERANVYITATPVEGYHFLDWSVRPSRSANPNWTIIRQSTTIRATFARNEITTITSNPVRQLITVDGGGYSTPVNFAWAPGETHVLGIYDSQPNFERFRFTGWSDGGAATHLITAKETATTYTANFVRQHSLTVATLGSLGSTVGVSPTSSDGFYDEGTVVQLVPDPTPGTSFAGWSGDLKGGTSPAAIVIDEQKVIYASFVGTSRLPPIAVVNAATGNQDALAPGELVSIYGANIGPSSPSGLQVSNGRVTTELAGTQVLFGTVPAPLTFVSAGQINAVVPYSVGDRIATTVQVRSGSQVTPPSTWSLQAVNPGIFTLDASGRGPGAVLNQDGTVNTPSNPADRGGIIVIYATGEGATIPAGVDGQVANSVYPKPVQPVSVRIGGLPAVVHYAGAAPGFVAGAMQINAQVPQGVQFGPRVPLHIVVGDSISSPGVTVAIR
jgi:uncharacterized protein (TIGR03437 family)